jgi:hypothetical protein
VYGAADDDESLATIRAAVDAGVRCGISTATRWP